MTGWANHDDIRSPDAFTALHAGLTVGLIATPRKVLMTCRTDESVSGVMARNTARYDFLPVVQAGGREADHIIGLFHAEPFFGARPEGHVRDHAIPLSEQYMIGNDASILDFILSADRRPCRLVIAGSNIAGLVSLSDFQKLPVRAALFGLVTGFEMTMSKLIEARVGTEEEWIEYLSPCRQKKIREEIEKSRRDDGFVNALLFTQFCDKRDIVTERIDLPCGRKDLETRLKGVEDLRNKLAHANEYAATPEQARAVCATVRDLLALHRDFSDAAGPNVPAPLKEKERSGRRAGAKI